MRTSVRWLGIVALALLVVTAPSPARAGGHGRGGRGWHGHHSHHHFHGGLVVVAPLWLDYPDFYWYLPPVDYVERPAYWYYCPSARAYYPAVPECDEPWILVPPRSE